MLFLQYSEINYTLQDFSCPSKKQDNDSSHEAQKPSVSSCNTLSEDKQLCFSQDAVDKENKYCCFLKIIKDGETKSGCAEMPRNYSSSNLKEKLEEEMAMFGVDFTIKYLKCPNETEYSSEITSNKGYYIKSGFVLFIAFLF